MSHPPRVDIIGVGDDGLSGLSATASTLIESADAIIGPAHLLRLVPGDPSRKVDTGSDLDALTSAIADRPQLRLVVLTVGDPLFFGVARFLCDRLGKERFNVVPHVSSMQLAFARVKENWDEAYLANLDTVPLVRALDRIRGCERAGLFTTAEHSPNRIAQQMLDRGLEYFTGYVCENLGSPDERVTRGELSEIAAMQFAPLNILILVRKPHRPDRPAATIPRRLFGYPDESYQQASPKRGLLTPLEIRLLALGFLELQPDSIVWDVGAGSGSVAIEAALVAGQGTVYAIEMDVEDHQLIKTNCRRIGVDNVVAVLGQAPEIWHDLPDPDAVFVGGTGRQVSGIAAAAWQRMARDGRLVIHVNSVDNVVDITRGLRQVGADFNVRMIQLSEGVDQLDAIRFESRHPTYLIHARKPRHRD